MQLRLSSSPSKFQSLFVNYYRKLVVQIAVNARAHNHILIQNGNSSSYHLLSTYVSGFVSSPESFRCLPCLEKPRTTILGQCSVCLTQSTECLFYHWNEKRILSFQLLLCHSFIFWKFIHSYFYKLIVWRSVVSWKQGRENSAFLEFSTYKTVNRYYIILTKPLWPELHSLVKPDSVLHMIDRCK